MSRTISLFSAQWADLSTEEFCIKAKEMGYDGIDAYRVDTFKDALHLTNFSQLCYKHYQEYKENNYL